MRGSEFYKKLILTLGVLVLILGPLHYFEILKPFLLLTIILLVFFSLLSIGVYYLGESFARSENKFLYNQLIIMNFVIKLVFSLAILFIYNKFASPQNNLFIIPFGLIYIAFTIFEAIFMSQQAKLSDKIKEKEVVG